MHEFSVHRSMGGHGVSFQRASQGASQPDRQEKDSGGPGSFDYPKNNDAGYAITGGMDPKTQFMVSQNLSSGQSYSSRWGGHHGWHRHSDGGGQVPFGGNDNGGAFGVYGGQAPAEQSGRPGQASTNDSGAGWNNNVSIMASSGAQNTTSNSYSGGNLVGGYLYDLEQGMDAGLNLDAANAKAQSKNAEGATSANVNANSLVKGKGGKALIVTGDNYGNDQDADQLAAKLKKDYGMDVQIIKNASPNQLKAALQKMGQDKGQQCMVAVMAHGVKDGSGNNNGKMAMGKGDGDQWLTEDMLKQEVNQYLSPNFDNVNVLLNSCYSGNFVS